MLAAEKTTFGSGLRNQPAHSPPEAAWRRGNEAVRRVEGAPRTPAGAAIPRPAARPACTWAGFLRGPPAPRLGSGHQGVGGGDAAHVALGATVKFPGRLATQAGR